MDKSVLITGAEGQLGNCLKDRLKNHPTLEMFYTDISTLDITDKEAFSHFITKHNITDIINCAAYTAVDKAEEDRETCRLVNTEAVRIIGESAAVTGARIIHISTDYVFDGKNHRPYTEEDVPHPLSVYGQTKYEGEKALMNAHNKAMILRTSWLYSEYGNNFVKTMLRLAQEHKEVRVVADQIGTPTYAGDLADALVEMLTNDIFTPGIYHFSNEGACSWYDFAHEIFKQSHQNTTVTPIGTVDYPTRAQRPYYSLLNKNKIKSILHRGIPHWTEGLNNCLRKMNF